MVTQDMEFKLELLCKLKEEYAELGSQIAALEDSVKSDMDAHGVSVLKVGSREVKYTRYFSSRFDSKSFRSDHAELYEQYVQPVPSTRFTVK